MAAIVNEVTQFAASCSECGWFGDVHDGGLHGDEVAERFADEDALAHNREAHAPKNGRAT